MAARPLLKIAFTSPQPVTDEPRRIAMLIEQGWTAVHLRHPGADEVTLSHILKSLTLDMLGRVVLHDHFQLAEQFPVGGLHLNSRNPFAPKGSTLATSISCHSIDEAFQARNHRYVTLSPIFDSISKPGYSRAFSDAELLRLLRCPNQVIALGGITAENAHSLAHYGFAGFAAMGAIAWHEDIQRFQSSISCFNS